MHDEEGLQIPGIDKLDAVSDLLAKKPLEMEPGLCTRARSRQSACDKCAAVCRLDAVSFDDDSGQPVVVDFARCSGCGACVTACPTGVFQYVGGLTDPDLVKKMAASLRDSDRKDLHLACHKVGEAVRANCFSLACHGRLHEGLLVAAARLGASRVRLVSRDCADCEAGDGRFLADYVKAVSQLSTALGFGTEFILTDEQGAAWNDVRTALIEKEQPTRRELFRGAFGLVGKATAGWVDDTLAPFASEQETAVGRRFLYRSSHKRQMLLGLIKEAKTAGRLDEPILPFADVTFTSDHCNLCGDCAFFCPTSALKLESGRSGGCELVFCAARCVGCGVCPIVCTKDALALGSAVNLAEIVAESGRLLKAATQKYECLLCGIEFFGAGPAPACPTCSQHTRLHGRQAALEALKPRPVPADGDG